MIVQPHAVLSELAKSYPIPIGLALLAWIPIDAVRGIVFSFHGGLGWLLLALAFPWLLGRVIVLLLTGTTEFSWRRLARAIIVLVAYLPVSILCAYSLLFALDPPLRETLPNALRWFFIPLSFIGGVW
jgi:hypothetical protein